MRALGLPAPTNRRSIGQVARSERRTLEEEQPLIVVAGPATGAGAAPSSSGGISLSGSSIMTAAALGHTHSWWPGKAPLKFRPAGSPAGSWPHTSWWVCVFHDPYERVNVWSHLLPGVALVVLGVLAHRKVVIGGPALVWFCAASAVTHLCSATTHVWPDDHVLEKLDHIGIVALIVGTPFTAAMAKDPEGDLRVMGAVAVALLGAAFLRPLFRTIAFVALGAVMFFFYFHIVNLNLALQVVLYLLGAYSFVRNGGHERWVGWTDHHLLHYWVSVACVMHVFYIRDAVRHQIHHPHAHAD